MMIAIRLAPVIYRASEWTADKVAKLLKRLARSAMLTIVASLPSYGFGQTPSWHYNTTITAIYGGVAGDRVAIYVSPTVDYGTCSATFGLTLDTNSPYFFSMYSIALTAFVKGKTVSIYTDGTCLKNGLQLRDLYIGTP